MSGVVLKMRGSENRELLHTRDHHPLFAAVRLEHGPIGYRSRVQLVLRDGNPMHRPIWESAYRALASTQHDHVAMPP